METIIDKLESMAIGISQDGSSIASVYPGVSPVLYNLSSALHSLAVDLRYKELLDRITISPVVKYLIERKHPGYTIGLPTWIRNSIVVSPMRVHSGINLKNVVEYIKSRHEEMYDRLINGDSIPLLAPECIEVTNIKVNEDNLLIWWPENLMTLHVTDYDFQNVQVLSSGILGDGITLQFDRDLERLVHASILKYLMGEDWDRYYGNEDIELMNRKLLESKINTDDPLHELMGDINDVLYNTSYNTKIGDLVSLRYDHNEECIQILRLEGIRSDNPIVTKDIVDDLEGFLELILENSK